MAAEARKFYFMVHHPSLIHTCRSIKMTEMAMFTAQYCCTVSETKLHNKSLLHDGTAGNGTCKNVAPNAHFRCCAEHPVALFIALPARSTKHCHASPDIAIESLPSLPSFILRALPLVAVCHSGGRIQFALSPSNLLGPRPTNVLPPSHPEVHTRPPISPISPN